MNPKQEKEFDNMLKGYLVLTDGDITIDKPRKKIKQFISKIRQQDKENFIKGLESLEMVEEPETFTKESGAICVDRDESLKNLVRAEINIKLKNPIKLLKK